MVVRSTLAAERLALFEDFGTAIYCKALLADINAIKANEIPVTPYIDNTNIVEA